MKIRNDSNKSMYYKLTGSKIRKTRVSDLLIFHAIKKSTVFSNMIL